MPYTINGFGTALSGNGAPIRWRKSGLFGPQADHDAMECIVALYIPIVPIRAVHTHDWNGNRYRAIEIRRTGALFLHAYLRPIGLVVAGGGLLGAGFGAFAAIADRNPLAVAWLISGLVAFAIGYGLLRLLRLLDRRTRDIRLVIGPHQGGSSDPATWTATVLASIPPADIARARAALSIQNFAGAMFLARVAAGQGNPEGEAITSEILTHPVIQAALPELRREPWRRAEILRLPGAADPRAVVAK